jgi:hypothetical protein
VLVRTDYTPKHRSHGRPAPQVAQEPARTDHTPRHGSWLNQIEMWLSMLMGKLLKRRS